ncbi:MAG: amidohydrolase [Syntrophorhabdaceae bacterium]|nr:amidohydrolase [Syntrophorhabdaceae bacterium]
MKVIDSHTHIFPPEIIKDRARIAKRDKNFNVIYGDLRAEMVDVHHLVRYMDREGIDRSVICSFPFLDRDILKLQNDYIIEAGRKNRRLIPLVSFPHDIKNLPFYELDGYMEAGAKGIGEVAFYDKGLQKETFCILDDVIPVIKRYKGILMLHINEQIGHIYKGKTSVDFIELVKFIERHQDTDIILAHLGGGVCFYEFMPEIKNIFKRVYYDTAALPFLYGEDIYRFIDGFLFDKVLFGSDFPLLGLGRYNKGISIMKKRHRERLLYKNAEALYGRE